MKKAFFGIFTVVFATLNFSNPASAAEVYLLDLSNYQNQNISTVLNDALRVHKSVKISAGNYRLSETILMNADNELDLNGSVLTSDVWGVLYNISTLGEEKSGYEGNGFTLKNGTIDLNNKAGLAIGHAPYALIDGITLKNTNGGSTHGIEISG